MVETKNNVTQAIDTYVSQLEKRITVNKVLLIGPYATGRVDEWSDIEVIVVSEDFADMSEVERVNFLARETITLDPRLMPFGGYTPNEYEHPENSLNMGWIKEQGKVVYQAA